MTSFGRHDYRDPAREKFGKPTISYPDGSLLHPSLTEIFDHRKDSTTGALPYLSLTQNPRVQGCYLTKQMLTKGDDDSTNLHVIYDRLPGVVKTSYPIDESNGYRMKVQSQVIIAVENPPWLGQRYSAEFTLTQQPSPMETVTVGGTTYAFVEVLSGAANEVLIGSFLQSTLYNLASAINLDWGIGVNFGTGTTANPNAVAWFSINTLVIADINASSESVVTGTTCADGSWNNSPTSTMVYIEEKEIDVNRVERVATRQIINGDTITSQRIDPDGVPVQIVKYLTSLSTALAVAPVEKITDGEWTKTTIESFSNQQAFLATESRVLPGNPIEKEKVLSGTSYETETRTMVQANTITVAETYDSGTGLLTKTETEPITELVSWKVVTVRPLPGPWIFDVSVDSESSNLMFNKQRKNYAGNITPGVKQVTGSGATISFTMAGGAISGVTILNGGTGYADVISIAFNLSGALPTRPAVVFLQSSQSNGVFDTVIIGDQGAGYGSTPTTNINHTSTVITERKNGRIYADPDEMDAQVPHEVVTIVPLGQSWIETESIPVHYPAILFTELDIYNGGINAGLPGFLYTAPIGSALLYHLPARQRTVDAFAVYWFSNGRDTLPSGPNLPGSPNVVNPTAPYNPSLQAWRLFFDFDVEDVYVDGGETYEGSATRDGETASFTIPILASSPDATTYLEYITDGKYLVHSFSSKRWHGNTFINKALYIPAL